MFKNKWRLAFFVSIILLLFVVVGAAYLILDQGYTITYTKDVYTNTENDLNTLINIYNETNLSKSQIQSQLKTHRFFEHINFKKDTISLERINLIFKNDTLKSIYKQW